MYKMNLNSNIPLCKTPNPISSVNYHQLIVRGAQGKVTEIKIVTAQDEDLVCHKSVISGFRGVSKKEFSDFLIET